MSKSYTNIIVGAGPAGLQLGYFFKQADMPYIILERAGQAASYYTKYPHSGKLISINKKHVGPDKPKDFRLRHDWNSLISDESHLFTSYSDEYYPDRNDLVKYLNDFATKYNLNIKYNAEVKSIKKTSQGYALTAVTSSSTESYTCVNLIIATGLSKAKNGEPTLVNNAKRPLKHYGDFPPNHFLDPENVKAYKDKRLLIIGNGNGAYELGNLLNPTASSITIYGKSPKSWAMSTHYAGDLRSVYLPFVDTFLLNSLNGFESSTQRLVIDQETHESKYMVSHFCEEEFCEARHPFLNVDFDEIILSTGWCFDASIFDFDVQLTQPKKKYPAINAKYESVNNSNLYFIGSLMHSMDYKKSSGGFVHGFRHLIRYFFNLNYTKQQDVKTFKITIAKQLTEVVEHILYKINNTSALFQMYGEMCDFFYEDEASGNIVYYNNVHKNHYLYTMDPTPGRTTFVLTLEYGSKPVTEIYDLGVRVTTIGNESRATLLHPVIRIYKDLPENRKRLLDEVHFEENFFGDFTNKAKYTDRITRAIKMFVDV